jgi:cardiolipin synthase
VIELLAVGSVERLWITDAYLLAPPRLFQALRDSARDGVDVRLLVPGSSDVPLIRNLSRIGYRDLLRSGVRIYEWDGPMLHAKTIMCDNRWVRIGSSNLNPSSLLGNYELDVLIEDPGLAGAMEDQFRHDMARSREVASRPVRGPRRISRALPVALTHQHPDAPAVYQRTRREARRRAALVLRAIASHARRSVFLPISAIFIALGLLLVALPKASAYVLAVICAWLAVGAAREAFRRRADR